MYILLISLKRSTEVDPENWVVFSRYNHYYEGQYFTETFDFPEGSPRQRFRVDVFLAINQSIINAFVPGSPSDFLSAVCPGEYQIFYFIYLYI